MLHRHLDTILFHICIRMMSWIFFTELAHRADSVSKLQCPGVMCVCLPVLSQKPRFPLDWKLLLKNPIAYNSFQMFEHFQDKNPHFFGKINLRWFVMQDFSNWIGLIVYWTNHSEKKLEGKFGIFVEVIFNDSFEIGVLGLTWRGTLLLRCNLNTLQSQISCLKTKCNSVQKGAVLAFFGTLAPLVFKKCWKKNVTLIKNS